jgi:membrane protease YdiL (CAAX protease family)
MAGGAVLRVVILLAVLVAVYIGLGAALSGLGRPQTLAALATAAVLLGGYVGLIRLVEKRRPVELAPRRAVPELLLGCLFGAGLFAGTVGIIGLLGFYHVDGTNRVGVIWATVGAAVLAGVFEELIVRGVLFRILEESLGSWLALAVTAAVFGALHLANPAATPVSAAAIALTAGVLLGLAYVATRRLWLPIGMHFAWNATESGLFGVPMSGITFDGLLRSHLSGPTLFSGGEFGVEGSVITVVTCLIAASGLAVWARRHGRIVRPVWRRNREAVAAAH